MLGTKGTDRFFYGRDEGICQFKGGFVEVFGNSETAENR
jgi:hypothetical protein